MSIAGSLLYFLLIQPTYINIILVLIAIIYLNRSNQENEDAIFIKGHDKADVCIVGGGFSGLCMAAKLKEAGLKFRLIEKDAVVGGTWHANQYPGCRCDVWSVLYQVKK